MDGLSAAERRRAGLGETQVTHLALGDEARHGADGLLDRRRWIDAVLVVEIDLLDAEPSKARLAARPDVVRLAVHAAQRPAGFADDAELGGEEGFRTPAADRAADELLVPPQAVDVGRVEEPAEVESGGSSR
jgi:hypothetical protein